MMISAASNNECKYRKNKKILFVMYEHVDRILPTHNYSVRNIMNKYEH